MKTKQDIKNRMTYLRSRINQIRVIRADYLDVQRKLRVELDELKTKTKK